jgi:hypothetical protein
MAFTNEGLRVLGIGSLLREHPLAVPRFQRSYAWEHDDVEDYWDDVLRAMRKSKNEDYFIGSIVLSQTSGPVLEVVDGQQRLATATIILGAIRDYFAEHGDSDRSQEIQSRYLVPRDEVTLDWEPRLALNTQDKAFFELHISRPAAGPRNFPKDTKAEPLKPSNKCIALAGAFIRESVNAYVARHGAADATTMLMEIVIYVRDHVKAICVTVPTHEDAYTVFETLNDRGLDLSKADLLKNHLLRKSSDRSRDEVISRWESMTGSLETVSRKAAITVDFIRYWWISTKGHVREKELYKVIKEDVTDSARATKLATDLADNAVLYAAILNSDHERWSEYGENATADLSVLIMLGIERLRPITLAIARWRPKEFEKAIYYLVCASVRILIASPAPGQVFEQRISKVAPLVTRGAIRSAKALAVEMNKEIVPNDATFQFGFASARVSQAFLARYYLRALENSVASSCKHPARVTKDDVLGTLEHILPENPLKGAWSHVPDDVRQAYVNRIGNLALLKQQDNVAAANEDFLKVKVPIYKAEKVFHLTKKLGRKTKPWDHNDIEARQQELAQMAVKTWPLAVT